MADKDLLRNPHNISDGAWWYEEPDGVSVVTSKPVMISWKALRAALKRKDKP